jgi:3-oxoacyl-ACP reductase-like protein
MEDHINFSAKYKSWVVVKKMKVDEEIEDADVGRLLISIRETLDNKIFEYLGTEFDIAALEKAADDMVPSGRLKEEQIASVIKAVRSPKTTKMLKEFTEEKLKLEVYKQLFAEIVMQKLNISSLTTKALDKYLDDKHRRL